jgi:hypothetical protein
MIFVMVTCCVLSDVRTEYLKCYLDQLQILRVKFN